MEKLHEKNLKTLVEAFVKSMLTDPTGDYLSTDYVNSEFDYSLSIEDMKEDFYELVSQMKYDKASSGDILRAIEDLRKSDKYKDISEENKEIIIDGAIRLVLEGRNR